MERSTSVYGDDEKIALHRLEDARVRMLLRNPFFGNLILHLECGLSKCGTATTDMTHLYFDPEFVKRLSDKEIDFVFKHEIMHCVLQHCMRGRELNQYFYNLACDIVVNSNILQSMGVKRFVVDGAEVMHLTPDGQEGFLFTAEEVYDMLMAQYEPLLRDVENALAQLQREDSARIDCHEIWKEVPPNDVLLNEWKIHLKTAVQKAGSSGECPSGARKFLDALKPNVTLDWRAVLHEFIHEIYDKHDFTFSPPDRRFSMGEFLLPAFAEVMDEQVERLWFVIDTSKSISQEALTSAFYEVKAASEQFDHLSGLLSFFDTSVSEPKAFSCVEDLEGIEPVGGGGTSFHCIFHRMREYFKGELPKAVIVLTDGYAFYPEEALTMGVPVLWIIAGENQHNAPFGVTIHI